MGVCACARVFSPQNRTKTHRIASDGTTDGYKTCHTFVRYICTIVRVHYVQINTILQFILLLAWLSHQPARWWECVKHNRAQTGTHTQQFGAATPQSRHIPCASLFVSVCVHMSAREMHGQIRLYSRALWWCCTVCGALKYTCMGMACAWLIKFPYKQNDDGEAPKTEQLSAYTMMMMMMCMCASSTTENTSESRSFSRLNASHQIGKIRAHSKSHERRVIVQTDFHVWYA